MSNSSGNNNSSGQGEGSHHMNPYDRQTPRNFPAADSTPALRQLSEFARPHIFSPGFPRTSIAGPMPVQPPTPAPPGLGGLSLGSPFLPPGSAMDPLLQFQIAGMQGM